MLGRAFERVPPKLPDDLLDAAFQELAEHGLDGASLERIAGAVDGQGALPPGVELIDLAVAVLERDAARHAALIGELRMPNTVDEYWSELWRVQTAGLTQLSQSQRGDMARLATSLMHHPEVQALLAPLSEMWHEKLTAFVQRGQEIGAVRKDVPVGVLIAMAHDLKQAAACAHLPTERRASASELQAFTQHYFALLQRISVPRV